MKRLSALLLACVALVGAACGDLTQPYAAKVNGERIAVEDLDRELKLILGNKRVQEAMAQGLQLAPGEEILGKGKGTLNMAVVANQLTLRVLYELVHQEVERRNITFTADEREQAEAAAARQFGDPALFRTLPKHYRDEIIRNTLEFGGLQQRLMEDANPTEAEIRAYYDENASQFTGRCVSHILVETPEEIDKLRADIVAGAPFADVARTASIDTGSGQQGGLLGCFPEGQPLEGIVEPFKSTAEALPVGQLSEPVQTQFGYHLIQVSNGRPFEEVRAELEQQLSQQSGQDRLRTLLTRLVKQARIEINPRYGKFVRTEPPFGRIVPPEAPVVGATTTTSTPQLFDPQG